VGSFKKSYLSIVILGLLEKRGAMYGLEIGELIQSRTAGQFKLQAGTTYPLLAELQKKGLIEPAQQADNIRGPIRKYVKLTEEGREALDQEKKHLLMLLGLIL